MAKKNKINIIEVKNPKIGECYRFRFAGSVMYGPVVEYMKDFSESHDCKYYWMVEENPERNSLSPKTRKPTRYPIPIYNILKNKKDV